MLELKFLSASIHDDEGEPIVYISKEFNKVEIEFTQSITLQQFNEILPLLQQSIISLTKWISHLLN